MKFLFVLLAAISLLQPYSSLAQQSHQHATTGAAQDPITGEIRYVCPMHSHIVRDHPGTCPICGMDLEPVRIQATGSDQQVRVEVDGDIQQAMSIVTEPVRRDDLWKYIETLGTVTFNESDISHIHSRVNGWLESLTVHAVGERVEKGQLLFTLYSPQLIVAQDDFLQVLDNAGGPSRDRLLKQARLRLTLLGIDEKVIQQLEQTRQSLYTVPFYAQQSGVVTALNVRHGMYVEPEMEMLAIADLKRLWVIADVFENQFDWLKLGKPAEIHLDSIGVHRVEARIDYIYPQLDPVTRSLKVRLSLDNTLERVKPGMTADVIIYGGPLRDVLVVNKQALIRTGEEARVVIRSSPTEFTVRPVQTGMQAQGKVEILAGLTEGEQVVTSGQFLLDSEANLAAGLQRLDSQSHAH
ncbi:efflux RND transporter periplasmic adaptor subunit [Bowmanella dokdonensis]|uniref:Efflux RND transporter periplasmic adaptor subunit n=1 Tax=Bowmanella dokdonensis TaxID=751969 RepID=A0A939ILE4_9ALTE|nr:efflux RND transporter periplasmic adaptor subunit [Bowmanella dokdonensis]MBN7824128.1 efflux RND transporter periplasmic adaptor subunit [Bowmanella dokdonensis]